MRLAWHGRRPLISAGRAPLLVVFVVACGGAPARNAPARNAPAPAPAHAPAPPSRAEETADCRGERRAILDAVTRSREQACSTVADCVKVTNPGHPSQEVQLVVHTTDAAALQARSDAHLVRCGAFMHREAIDAFVVVEPACTAGHCVATETTYHVD